MQRDTNGWDRTDTLKKFAERWKANPFNVRNAIKAKCLDCCNGERLEIEQCNITSCGLHAIRPYQTEAELAVKPKRKAPEGGYHFKKKDKE